MAPTRIQMASLGAGVAQTQGGAVRANASGTIKHASDGSSVTLYADKTGATTVGVGSFITDTRGRVPGWLDIADWGVEVLITVPPADPVTAVVGLTGPAGPAGAGVNFRGPYGSGTTYALNDAVLGSDQIWYQSLAGSNIGHDPVTDGLVHWAPVNGPNVAVIGAGSAGRDKVLVTPTGVGVGPLVSASDSPYSIVPDARIVAFTSASGTTLTSTGVVASDVTKVVCVPGAGRDDGFGIKGNWTTTITNVTPGTSATVANAFPTAVTTGTNRNAAIGKDWTTQLNNFVTAIGTAGARSILPLGNILHTGTIDFQPGVAQGKGLPFEGQAAGTLNPTATAGTSFWFVGPIAAAGNGAGIPAMQAADTSDRGGLKQKHFSIQCLCPLAVSTTVTGAGQVISTSPITLTVGSTAGMPAKGRIQIVGGVEAQYTGVGSSTTLTGVQVVSGSYTTVGGEVVRTITAAIYWDFMRAAAFDDVYVAAYQDNNAVITNGNQGRAAWFNNFSTGVSKLGSLTTRYFLGGVEAVRVGSANTGYGVRGNSGNCHFDVITCFDCSSGVYCHAEAGSPVDGNVFSTIKVTGAGTPGTLPDGSPTFALKVDSGWQGNFFSGIHSEGCFNTVICNGHGNVFSGLFSSWQSAAVGGADGSAQVSFAGNGNRVDGANPQGWTGGVPGAPTGTKGFSYAAAFASGTTGNRVAARPATNFTVFGIGLANYNGSTGNLVTDLTAAAIPGDAGSGQQAGIVAPDGRTAGGISGQTFIANQAYFARFVPTRPIACLKIAYNISTAATVNDNVDVGIYQVSGTQLARVASSGSTAGKVNAGGVIVVNVVVNLLPGVVYYAAIAYGTVGGTAAAIQSRAYGSSSNAGLFGGVAGTSESGTLTSGFPLPAGPVTVAWNAANIPILAVREA